MIKSLAEHFLPEYYGKSSHSSSLTWKLVFEGRALVKEADKTMLKDFRDYEKVLAAEAKNDPSLKPVLDEYRRQCAEMARR